MQYSLRSPLQAQSTFAMTHKASHDKSSAQDTTTARPRRTLTKKISRTFTLRVHSKSSTRGADSTTTTTSSATSDSGSETNQSPPSPSHAAFLHQPLMETPTTRSARRDSFSRSSSSSSGSMSRPSSVASSTYDMAGYAAGRYAVNLEALYAEEEASPTTGDDSAEISRRGLKKFSAQDYASLL